MFGLGSSISGLAESTAAANRLHAISIFPEYHMELHLISIASLKPMVSQQASWISSNGLPTSNCMQGHNLVDPFQASSFSFMFRLGSSISGLAESTAAANRLHAISIFPEYHMELHLISIASLKPMVSQQASWCFCWFENSHPVA
ncbi:Presequence protease [Trichinella spiralis]|uniref:Presequence protease n=1 Tax=Trichinella spiralis TaxID=6334 RepID=A0ABR3K5F6_TRISP